MWLFGLGIYFSFHKWKTPFYTVAVSFCELGQPLKHRNFSIQVRRRNIYLYIYRLATLHYSNDILLLKFNKILLNLHSFTHTSLWRNECKSSYESNIILATINILNWRALRVVSTQQFTLFLPAIKWSQDLVMSLLFFPNHLHFWI